MIKSIWNDSNRKLVRAHIERSQTNSIYTDRSFFDNVSRKFCREFKSVQPATGFVFAEYTGGRGINMTLHNVSIQPAIHFHSPLQVNFPTGLPVSKRCFFEDLSNCTDAV